LRNVVKVEALVRAHRFVDCKVLWHQVRPCESSSFLWERV